MGLLSAIVYGLCLLGSGLCALLLWRAHAAQRSDLIFWSAICFSLLTLNHVVVIIDVLIGPAADLQLLRLALSLIAGGALIFGFIWKLDED
ncbi:hypothetical protein ACFB49_27170 [Sphingomonas sp. DBB INV C78]|uniref:DUF5985 family protein n=1 Tax=Sphingomonas sp. DBB INV C78 TaxID=3349434 RepID=UPI0036D35FE0